MEQCFSLEQKLKSVEIEINQKKNLKFNGIVFQDELGNNYCPTYYQSKEARAILLLSNDADEDEAWRCPVCKLSPESKAATLRRRDRLNQLTSQRAQEIFRI